jgi:hypothetical protein
VAPLPCLQSLNKAYPDVTDEPIVAACNNAKFGDYQCNNAMQLFAKLKGKVCGVACCVHSSTHFGECSVTSIGGLWFELTVQSTMPLTA